MSRWYDMTPVQKKRALEMQAAWRRKNKERSSASQRARCKRWREAHPERSAAACKNWDTAHPEVRAALNAKRRARRLAQTPPLTAEQQADIIALYAKARALTELTGEPYHVDHKKPLSKGGLHHPDNLQVLRGIDNLKKGAKLL